MTNQTQLTKRLVDEIEALTDPGEIDYRVLLDALASCSPPLVLTEVKEGNPASIELLTR